VKAYAWKHFYSTIKVELNEKTISMLELMNHKQVEAEIGMRHAFANTIPPKLSYRRYRRGKKRCLFCGMKLGTKDHRVYEEARGL